MRLRLDRRRIAFAEVFENFGSLHPEYLKGQPAVPIEPGADVLRIKIEQLLCDGRKGRQMKAQRSIRRNANVSARNVAEQYRAGREAGVRNSFIHPLGLK